MKVYDPAEGIVYVHMAEPVQRRATSSRVDHVTLDRLPVGYANQSPRTRVRKDAAPSAFRLA